MRYGCISCSTVNDFWYIDAPSEESIEREAGDENAVRELKDSGQNEKDEEGVDEFESGGGVVEVCTPERLDSAGRR